MIYNYLSEEIFICFTFTYFYVSSLLFMFYMYHAFLSVHCSLVFTCWEWANILILLCLMFFFILKTPKVILEFIYLLINLIINIILRRYFMLIVAIEIV